MVFTVLGNILVILSIFTYRPLHNVQNMFMVSLAVADIMVAVLVMPFNVAYNIIGKWIFGIFLCQMWLTSDVMCCTASVSQYHVELNHSLIFIWFFLFSFIHFIRLIHSDLEFMCYCIGKSNWISYILTFLHSYILTFSFYCQHFSAKFFSWNFTFKSPP